MINTQELQAREPAEPYFQGYIFVPYCTQSCCPTQPQRFQPYSDFYHSSISKYETISAEPSHPGQAHSSRFSSQGEPGYSVVFPAIPRVRPQPYEISCHNVRLEDSYLHAQKGWKLETGSKPKRNRTIFTADQLERLEKEFDRQQYIVGTQRFYLAADLGLNETQVKVWFQNRRIKWRRQKLESACSVEIKRFERDDKEGERFSKNMLDASSSAS